METTSLWFSENIVPTLNGYEIRYRYFTNGDFGSLCEIELENEHYQCSVNFWGDGHLGIIVFGLAQEIERINVMISKEDEEGKRNALKGLIELLKP